MDLKDLLNIPLLAEATYVLDPLQTACNGKCIAWNSPMPFSDNLPRPFFQQSFLQTYRACEFPAVCVFPKVILQIQPPRVFELWTTLCLARHESGTVSCSPLGHLSSVHHRLHDHCHCDSRGKGPSKKCRHERLRELPGWKRPSNK